ncbi:MAG: hypothetical protein NVV72_07165 [Asticcacaulis sp.]|nr:hypothetical protein [Asticcacaulis sp.]
MNARVASVDIRYPRPEVLPEINGFQANAFRPLPLSIQTENVQMELIQAGQDLGALPGVYRPVDDQAAAQTGWMWAVFTRRGDPLGFINLNATSASPDFDCYYGPHLDIACRRDGLHAPYVPEAIAGLLEWLRAHDICFVIHADHAENDRQLADWLTGAGFLYTGCHSREDRQQMICLL